MRFSNAIANAKEITERVAATADVVQQRTTNETSIFLGESTIYTSTISIILSIKYRQLPTAMNSYDWIKQLYDNRRRINWKLFPVAKRSNVIPLHCIRFYKIATLLRLLSMETFKDYRCKSDKVIMVCGFSPDRFASVRPTLANPIDFVVVAKLIGDGSSTFEHDQ